MLKYPMIERANGAGRRAEEGLAAFCSFLHFILVLISILGGGRGVCSSFLASLFYIYTCFDYSRAEHLFLTIFIFPQGTWLRLHFFVFLHLDPEAG